MTKYFLDTCSLLNLGNKVLDFESPFVVSDVTIKELESIKTSGKKDEVTKFKARQILHILVNNSDKFETFICDLDVLKSIEELALEDTNDNRIICSAMKYSGIFEPVVFVTDDLACYEIAKQIVEIEVCMSRDIFKEDNKEIYTGYKTVSLEDREMAKFYENLRINIFECLENQYVIIKDIDGNVKDTRRWTSANGYVEVFNKIVKSNAMKSKIKAKDEFQLMAIDSIFNNTMTVISGKAGSGKSLLALSSAMNLIELGKYKKLVILYNPTKVKGATELGWYKGTAIEKAMQNSIGEILCTKFNDTKTVESMIVSEEIKLISMSDCRGTEIKDDEILWITESQNTSIELMKLCLSRCSQNAKIIIEGDYLSQVDNYVFENDNNGMKRAIDILQGEDIFGYVELKNVWRSRIANLVDKF